MTKNITITITFQAKDDEDAEDFKDSPMLLPSEAWLKEKYLEQGLELVGWQVAIDLPRGEGPKRLARRFDKSMANPSADATDAQVKLIKHLMAERDWKTAFKKKPSTDLDSTAISKGLSKGLNPSISLTVEEASATISWLKGMDRRFTPVPGTIVKSPVSGKKYKFVQSKTGNIYAKVAHLGSSNYSYIEDALLELYHDILEVDPTYKGALPSAKYPDERS